MITQASACTTRSRGRLAAVTATMAAPATFSPQ